MLVIIKNFFTRFFNYTIWLGLAGLLSVIAVLIIMLRINKKKLRKLESDLIVTSAKLKLENVLIRNRITAEDLRELQNMKDEIKNEIYSLGKQLEIRLRDKLTAEEIVQKFKEIGIP